MATAIMSWIDHQTLLKLPVQTKSGAPLGRVAGFDFDVESQTVLRWHVRPKGLAARVLKKPLLISRDQVVSIDAEKMVVDDGLEKAMELEKARAIGLVSKAEA